ncbi:MAG: hypothetical protein IH886_08360 [Nitrospinae bacterium]|nr:hypothetical protein [Nitrospinota bacterium]
MTEKRKLPNRRNGVTQKMKISGQTIYLRTGEFEDGSLGEIFIDLSKEGALIRSLMNCFAIAISVALQSGASLEDLCDKFMFTRFEPAGIVENNQDIKMCSSILDAIFKDLAINYLDRKDLKHSTEKLGKEA